MSSIASARPGPPQQRNSAPVVGNYIDGQVVAPSAGTDSLITDPATGAVTKSVHLSSAADVDVAVRSASAAAESWGLVPPLVRARVLFRFRDLIEQHGDRIARLITSEHGKTIDDAFGEVQRGLEVVEFACGVPQLLKGEHSAQVGRGIDSFSLHQPLGVVAGITPFNFPAMVPMWMFPVAIACGNAFVLKPSEKDPSASIALAELFTEAGGPPGVLNVVQGGVEATNALVTHPLVEAISFVGSTAVAEHVYRTGTAAGKRVQALGGAKNHAVVMPDADLDRAAKALLGAAYGSAGERCMAISVAVTVGDDTADALIEHLTPLVEQLRIGAGDVDGTEMGPLVTQQHCAKVRSYIDQGVAEGADLVVDGRKREFVSGGFFLGGTLFDRVSPRMTIYREEIFGPVLAVVRVDTRSGTSARQRPRVRQRRRDLHPRWQCRPHLHLPGKGRDGGDQHSAAGPDGLPLLRRLEALHVRRLLDLRSRWRAVLHPSQDRSDPLARGH